MWTLPWGVVACLLMPFGLERLALVPMGWGIDVTIWVARTRVGPCPAMSGRCRACRRPGCVLVSLGGLWLCLWQRRWRRWGLAAIAAGLATMLLTPPARYRARRSRPLRRGARQRTATISVAAGGKRSSARSSSPRPAPTLLPWPEAGAAAGRARLRRGPLPSTEPTAEGRDRHRRGGLAGLMHRVRRDRRASAGRLPLPLADPGRRPHRHLAARRDRAVARPRRRHRRERQPEPRRPALGAASRSRRERAGPRITRTHCDAETAPSGSAAAPLRPKTEPGSGAPRQYAGGRSLPSADHPLPSL